MSDLPEIPDESEDVADGQVDDETRDSCAELDTLPPKEFFGRFEARVREGTQWLNDRTRLWFDEAKRRIRLYMDERGLTIRSFALGVKDGKVGIWMTFFRENWERVHRPSFLHAEDGQEGPVVKAWVSVKAMRYVFRRKSDGSDVDAAMADVGNEMGHISDQVKTAGASENVKERINKAGRKIAAITRLVRIRCKRAQKRAGYK